MKGDAKAFTLGIMHWHRHHNQRSLPWKSETGAYRIWLSEILLQQTRIAQGLPYYLKFIEAYPTVEDLAASTDDAAFKLWEGLGYYARCRNMLATARQVAGELGGRFPDTYEGLLRLKGVGPSTAAAVASFAYGLPHAVVDGNVYRVLARYFGIRTPIDSNEGKKLFQALADRVLDRSDPGGFNQGIMDHGSTVCTPVAPRCGDCPVSAGCVALAEGLIGLLPVKAKRTAVRTRHLHYLILHHDGHIWIRRRGVGDIWAGLYEPFLVESDARLYSDDLRDRPEYQALGIPAQPENTGSLRQRLTHQLIETGFFEVQATAQPTVPEDGIWVPHGDLRDYPFPRTLVAFFEKKGYF